MEVYSLLLVRFVHHGDDFSSFSCFFLLIQLFVSDPNKKKKKNSEVKVGANSTRLSLGRWDGKEKTSSSEVGHCLFI